MGIDKGCPARDDPDADRLERFREILLIGPLNDPANVRHDFPALDFPCLIGEQTQALKMRNVMAEVT